jgi:hypothetical protein
VGGCVCQSCHLQRISSRPREESQDLIRWNWLLQKQNTLTVCFNTFGSIGWV